MATKTSKKAYSDQKKAAALANALMDLPDEWVMCRDMRHAWSVLNDFHVTAGKGKVISEIKRELTCVRCKTDRVETYHHTSFGLEKVHQHYRYPEHYQMKGVPRGVKPQALVQDEQYRRAMEKIAKGA